MHCNIAVRSRVELWRPTAQSYVWNEPWVMFRTLSASRTLIDSVAQAQSDTFATQPQVKFRYSRLSRFSSPVNTVKSLYAITVTCRLQKKSESDSNAKARSFRRLPTRKLCCMVSRVPLQRFERQYPKCLVERKALFRCSSSRPPN